MARQFGEAVNECINSKTTSDLALLKLRQDVRDGKKPFSREELLHIAQECRRCSQALLEAAEKLVEGQQAGS
ncbi:MAG: hypothetical protein ABI905_01550 [Betaproteobacteria bacterium]